MLKRFFDIFISVLGLLSLSPLLLFVAVWIKASSEGPVFFLQERVGRDGKLFKIIKFRSMVKEAPQLGPAITGGDDPRITTTGRFLRRTKVDELPQLFNVLKGEMSLVGPRPEVPKYVDMKDPVWKIVLKVRPGITGISQIAYIDEEGLLANQADSENYYIRHLLPQKLAIDQNYVNNNNFFLDLKIMFQTLSGIR